MRWRAALPSARIAAALLFLSACHESGIAVAVEPAPPKPTTYFNDYAQVVSSPTATALERRLAQFERDTSSQVLVVIYKRIPGDDALEEFTQRTAEAWGVGRKQESNGVVLFVFTEPRLIRIEVGYGLEGALPDVLAGRIITDEIRPAFRAGDFDGGITRGVDAILRATQGEYKGTGRTTNTSRRESSAFLIFLLIIFVIFVLQSIQRARAMRRGVLYGPRGRRGIVPRAGSSVWPIGGGWGGGSWGGGGGGWGGGGGGCSGGGGSFGGGGASGSW